jgi:hypothetical protein
MAFPVGWARKCALTIQHAQVTADQTSFPALLAYNAVGTETNLPGEMLDSSSPNKAKSDGSDIRFTSDAAGNNGLHFEIVVWTQNATQGNRQAEIWVNVNPLTASDVTIYVWYSNAGATAPPANDATFGSQGLWDTNYKGVWHLSSSLTAESTSAARTATNAGCSSASGRIANGVSVASGNTLNCSDTGLQTAGHLTLEGWLNTSNASTSMIFLNYGTNGGNQVYLGVYNLGDPQTHEAIFGAAGSGNVGCLVNVNDGAWHHVVGVFDGTNIKIFLDGAQKNSKAGTPAITLSGTAHLVNDLGGTQPYIGSLDELRISNIDRSSSWIATQYNNQSAPQNFWSVGTPTSATFQAAWARGSNQLIGGGIL